MTSHPSLYRVVIPGLLGNVLEWYDFALYGYFAAILTPLFFPSKDATVGLIATFEVFAIGFLVRPLGAIVFGYIGDRFGRKQALSASIILMAIPTTFIGLLPDHQQIGILAPTLLIICRLLQGLAVGGEFTGSMVYLLEHAPDFRRGLYGALIMASAFCGLLLGAIAATIVKLFTIVWLWRIPFLLSIILGALGLYLRLRMPESPVFEELKKTHQININPFKELVSRHSLLILKGTALVVLPATAFYITFLYLPTYLNYFLTVNLLHAMIINTLTLFLLILACPLIGFLADKIGKWQVLIVGASSFFYYRFLYTFYWERGAQVLFLLVRLFSR